MSKNDAYSALKATRHLDIIQGVREGRPVRPAHVQIILSDLCNQACHFCSYRSPGYSSSEMFYEIKPQGAGLRRDEEHQERNYNPSRMIPWLKVLEILDDCRDMGVSGIQLTGGGEPTVHPNFLDAGLSILDRGMALSMVTNGVNIGKKWVDNEDFHHVFRRASWARVSIDAGSKDTYCKVRNVPDWHWDSAWAAVRALRAASDAGGGKLVVGAGFVVTPENWPEVCSFTAKAKEAGAHNVRISAQFSNDDEKLFASFYNDASYLCASTVDIFSDEHFTVYNRFGEKLEDLRQKRPDYQRCGYQEFTTYIGGDLNVYRCCVQSYNKHGLVGSLENQRFKDLWLSQERADEMRKFKASSCERCQFNAVQKVINYAIEQEDPDHSEFV